ncbi:Protein FAR-RED IMPAIRED RESPONSE 1 [Bienertia sinuspersici]
MFVADLGFNPCLIVHHGGHWTSDDGLVYVGGKVNVFEDISESITVSYVRGIINSLGYKNIIKLHFHDPRKDFHIGIRYFGYDRSTFAPFLSLLLKFKVIHVYTKHEVVVEREDITTGSGHNNESFVGLLTSMELPMSLNVSDEGEVDYDIDGTDEDDDEMVNAREKVKEDKRVQVSNEEELLMLKRLAKTKGKNINDLNTEFDGGSNLDSGSESDDEDCGYLVAPEPHMNNTKKNKLLEEGESSRQSKFHIGQTFENAKTFKNAIIDYSIEVGRDIPFSRNDKNRVHAVCASKEKGCPWRIWASWVRDKKTFMVKTHNSQHTCGRTNKLKKMTAAWIASNYQTKFKVHPYIKLHDIIETVWLEWGVKVIKFMAYRARKRGQALIVGEYKEQYALLPRYATEVLRSNRNNSVKLQMNGNVFQRVYFCFEALRKGFMAGCRLFISLDGCFLKGPFGGQLLVEVGRDGNNQMFPIAWAIVEVECTDSWRWFLSLLASDLGSFIGAGSTFMSDQQKRLLAAVAEVFPEAETRVCARHVYCNFRTIFGGGMEYRKQFWIIAKSSTENEFNAQIQVMREISNAATDDLLNRNYKKWCRAFYFPMSCCDSVDNNMSEVFNAYILSSRHKPIITMLEDIREGLMERLHKKRDDIGKKELLLCPRIQQQVEKHKIYARGWNAFWDGGVLLWC